MNLKKKDIDSIIKSIGLDPKQWREDVLNHARLSIMDKQGEIYKEFEQNIIEKEALKLLIENSSKLQERAVDKQAFKNEENKHKNNN